MQQLFTQKSVSVPANGSVQDVLGDTRFDYAPDAGFVNLYATGSALGLTARFLVGSDEVGESVEISAENRMPIENEDLLFGGIGVDMKDRLTLNVTNTTAGAITFFVRVALQPIGMSALVQQVG